MNSALNICSQSTPAHSVHHIIPVTYITRSLKFQSLACTEVRLAAAYDKVSLPHKRQYGASREGKKNWRNGMDGIFLPHFLKKRGIFTAFFLFYSS